MASNRPFKLEIIKAIETLRTELWKFTQHGVEYNVRDPLFEVSLGGRDTAELQEKFSDLTNIYDKTYSEIYGPLKGGWSHTGLLYLHGLTFQDFSFLPALPVLFRLVLFADEIFSFKGFSPTPHLGKFELGGEMKIRSYKGLTQHQIIAIIGSNDSRGKELYIHVADAQEQELVREAYEEFIRLESETRIGYYVDETGKDRAFVRTRDEEHLPDYWGALQDKGLASKVVAHHESQSRPGV